MPTPTIHAFRKTFVASFWLGVLGAPIVWAIHLQTVYSLVIVAQRTHSVAWLVATTVVCALLSLGCGWLSWCDWRAVRHAPSTTESSDPAGRTRFFSVLGCFSGLLFTVVIVATGVAVCFLKPSWI